MRNFFFVRTKGASDKVKPSGLPAWALRLLSIGAAVLGLLGGWVMPQFQSGWWQGEGGLRIGVGVLLVVLSARLAYATSVHGGEKNRDECLHQVVSGLFEAGKRLSDFSVKDASASESKKVREELAKELAAALSHSGRKAQIVVYMMERRDNEESDGQPDGDSARSRNRYFKMDCFAGRADRPRRDKWDWETEVGRFFCDQMIGNKQTVVNDINRPPTEAKLDVADSACYRSFILTPIHDSKKSVRGAVSIDYREKLRFVPFDVDVAWRIANLFSDTFVESARSSQSVDREIREILENVQWKGGRK
ncbi:MAG: hypothetical protein Q4A31_06100 [Corynebacterium sp.]|uniref:hypothetical protein n=1 Tax=Corynebacterium sp. TaxID=1720 RepID=UPI0026DCE115|nr:hypothetical protein [Corynebacterium sp.]MDO4761471.1 hypothetical protein [Corynebacterium sp.]